jgi:hypothetical protein
MFYKTLKNKIEQFLRLVFINSITIHNKSILLVEYPKSGGTWLGQLLSNYLNIPFPRNRFPILRQSLFHSHYLPVYRIPRNKKIIYLVRDGRDVIVSLYFHQLLWNEKNRLSPKDVIYHRSKVPFNDFENVKQNMYSFIKYTFEQNPSRFQHYTYMGNWYDYNKAWLEEMKTNENIYLVKYEDLLENPFKTLSLMFETMFNEQKVDELHLRHIINKFSFENQSKRKKGEENINSFLRKGIKGDWKNYFGGKEKDLYKKHTKDLLVELNYEKDNNW